MEGWTKYQQFWWIIQWNLFPRIQFESISNGLGSGLVLYRRQAINWTNDNQLTDVCIDAWPVINVLNTILCLS